MKILAIETSCDETGVCVLEQATSHGDVGLLANALASQIDIHSQYGGVFPALAKRAHTDKIIPLLTDALTQAGLLVEGKGTTGTTAKETITALCTKDTQLAEYLEVFLNSCSKPAIDYIAVTVGPGLEPALWVGVNTARVLSVVWDIPIIPINHMEGHVVTAAFEEIESGKWKVEGKREQKRYTLKNLQFPVLALLVSGGHTELVIAEAFGTYKKIGKTRDDAVGEAFDKVARMLGLPYPGGPAISKLAAGFRMTETQNPFSLPRPMLHSNDYDFSFSGIKTAVLYAIRDHGEMNDVDKMAMACEFENAAIEVLVKKTLTAAAEFHTPTIIVGGGVAGNTYLRKQLTTLSRQGLGSTNVLFPEPWLATDNAIMIGMAAITRLLPTNREGGQAQLNAGQIKKSAPENLRADGNLSIDN